MTPVAGSISELPDTLVLGAGGTLGEAWTRGLLSGLSAAASLDFRDCEYVLGTSRGLDRGGDAGLGPAARRRRPRRARIGRPRLTTRRRHRRSRASPGRPSAPACCRRGAARADRLRGPRSGGPARTVGRACRSRPARSARSTRLIGFLDSLGGELRRPPAGGGGGPRQRARVLFGAPGAPDALVRDAVLASCAVPWLFAPVEIGGREYVDGGVWSPVNLDAAPGGRGAHVLCLAPTGRRRPAAPGHRRGAGGRGDGAARPRACGCASLVPDGGLGLPRSGRRSDGRRPRRAGARCRVRARSRARGLSGPYGPVRQIANACTVQFSETPVVVSVAVTVHTVFDVARLWLDRDPAPGCGRQAAATHGHLAGWTGLR